MKKTTKNWLIIASILIALGGIIFVGVMMKLKWDFSKIATNKYVDNFYEITEEFQNISINASTSDIVFAVSDDGKCRVECHEDDKELHMVGVREGTLFVEITNTKDWYDYIGISFGTSKIKVYLPKDMVLTNVEITASTSDILLEDMNAKNIEISVTTGDVSVRDVICEGNITHQVSTGDAWFKKVQCYNLTSNGTTGDIALDDVILSEKLSIKRGTGDTRIKETDAKEVSIETNTGDVIGIFLSEKVFETHSNTGEIVVPHTTKGGKCVIRTNTGDININIKE